jgi:hypothetical protein
MSDHEKFVPKQEMLDQVYEIVRTHPAPVVLDSFARYGLTDRTKVDACLAQLERQGKIMRAPLFAPLS